MDNKHLSLPHLGSASLQVRTLLQAVFWEVMTTNFKHARRSRTSTSIPE